MPAQPTDTSPAQPADPSRIILLLSVAAFASSASMRVCDPMLPRMAADFAVGLPEVSAVIAFFSIAYGGLQIVYGPLGDRVGKLRLIGIATAAASLTSLACALAPSLRWLIAGRLASGVIAAAIIPLSFAWIGDVVPFERRQPVLARFLSGSILGAILGQLIGGVMADTVGWRAAFGVLALVFLAAGATLLRQVRRGREPEPAARITGQGWFAPYRELTADRWVRTVLAIVAAEGMVVFGATAFIPTWLHQRDGLSLTVAGLIAAVFAIGGLIYTSLAVRLLRRLGDHGLAFAGGLSLAGGLLVMALAPGWLAGALASLLMGVGFYAMHNTLQTHGTQLSATQRATGMAMFAACYFLGQSIGVTVASTIVERAGFIALFVAYAAATALLALWLRAVLMKRRASQAAPAGHG
ncbi:MAG TPA: MFS transporter [Burkholderiaceae bacterium]|nr:MFS transporter [Burkholderiaceae bacterium]